MILGMLGKTVIFKVWTDQVHPILLFFIIWLEDIRRLVNLTETFLQ